MQENNRVKPYFFALGRFDILHAKPMQRRNLYLCTCNLITILNVLKAYEYHGDAQWCKQHLSIQEKQYSSLPLLTVGDYLKFRLPDDRKINDADIAESFKYCPDQRAIHLLQASFGKLSRIGTLGGTTWTKKIQTKPCRLVLAHPCITEETRRTIEGLRSMSQMSERIEQDESLRNNTLMVVDTFKDESSRRHLATSIGCDLPVNSDDPKELTYYMTNVAQFGFDHIIIIGEIENGMIFLDCYGRVFQWEEECQMLWPFGNSLEEAMSNDEKNQVP
ncbi:692_t:CDS:2 [Paraglomus brasilianum]|uniref:692_t:CDS:1 n=1 Tax=Paraglomus brasilianum TaxID=144538 RepID=A0A9N9GVN6_9GLOM|nr:692_t:CDS:2 [Paraglomus brasilianum]